MNNEALEAYKRVWERIQNRDEEMLYDLSIIRQALTPEVGDLDALIREMQEQMGFKAYTSDLITRLSKRGLLRGDVAGMVMVPFEPTPEMIWAGQWSIPTDAKGKISGLRSIVEPDFDENPNSCGDPVPMWKAMIKAARGE